MSRIVRVPERTPESGDWLYCQTHKRMEPISPGVYRFSEGVVDHPGLFADLDGEPFTYTCTPESV